MSKMAKWIAAAAFCAAVFATGEVARGTANFFNVVPVREAAGGGIVRGLEQAAWDLSVFYKSPDDPAIAADVETFAAAAKRFKAAHRGKLRKTLGAAIRDLSALEKTRDKIGTYFLLASSVDVTDGAVKTRTAAAEAAIAAVSADCLSFFDPELKKIPEKTLVRLRTTDKTVAEHWPWISRKRAFRARSEETEAALERRERFGESAWSELFDELESGLEVRVGKRTVPFGRALAELGGETDPRGRAELLAGANDALGGPFGTFAAQTLYVVAGMHNADNRAGDTPMDARNVANMVSAEAVVALHEAVRGKGGELARRHYRLKAKLLGLQKLRWADRNAPMPFGNGFFMPYAEAEKLVVGAFAEFDPAFGAIAREMVGKKRIDARVSDKRRSGAYCATSVLPCGTPVSFVFMSYRGSAHDVLVLAHELGHAVHGVLAARAKPCLLANAPIAYCETASLFAEALVREKLRALALGKGDKAAALALDVEAIEGELNTVVRQIQFSDFERRLHGMDAAYEKWETPKKWTAKDLDGLWLETLERYYGKDGDVFAYENAEHLWAYVSHFQSPFYVYGYAFGDLCAGAIRAEIAASGGVLVPEYLEALRSGATRDAEAFLAPFGFDPGNRECWIGALESGLGKRIAEAERMSRELGFD